MKSRKQSSATRKKAIRPKSTKQVVILVDMQANFVDNLLSSVRKRIVAAQRRVLTNCANKDIPVVVLEYKGNGKTIPELSKILRRVRRKVVIEKGHDDGFDGTDLVEVLRKLEATSLVMMGINAHACVWHTAQSAVFLGYRVRTSEALIAQGFQAHISEYCKDWYLQNGCIVPTKALLTRAA